MRAACHRALAARDRRLVEYPHWEAWRRRGREIKAETVSRLDELLERLAREVERRERRSKNVSVGFSLRQ